MTTAYLDKKDLQIKTTEGLVFNSWEEAEQFFLDKEYHGTKDQFESAFACWAESNEVVILD